MCLPGVELKLVFGRILDLLLNDMMETIIMVTSGIL